MTQASEALCRVMYALRREVDGAFTGNAYYMASALVRDLSEVTGANGAAAPDAEPIGFGAALAAARARISADLTDNRYYLAAHKLDALASLAAQEGVVVAESGAAAFPPVEPAAPAARDGDAVSPAADAAPDVVPEPDIAKSALNGSAPTRSFDDLAAASETRLHSAAQSMGVAVASAPLQAGDEGDGSVAEAVPAESAVPEQSEVLAASVEAQAEPASLHDDAAVEAPAEISPAPVSEEPQQPEVLSDQAAAARSLDELATASEARLQGVSDAEQVFEVEAVEAEAAPVQESVAVEALAESLAEAEAPAVQEPEPSAEPAPILAQEETQQQETLADGEWERRSSEPCYMPAIEPIDMEAVAAASVSAAATPTAAVLPDALEKGSPHVAPGSAEPDAQPEPEPATAQEETASAAVELAPSADDSAPASTGEQVEEAAAAPEAEGLQDADQPATSAADEVADAGQAEPAQAASESASAQVEAAPSTGAQPAAPAPEQAQQSAEHPKARKSLFSLWLDCVFGKRRSE